MNEKHPPFIVEFADTLYVAADGEKWSPGQIVQVPFNAHEYYDVCLTERDKSWKKEYPDVDFWRFTSPILQETDPVELYPWEAATDKQLARIDYLVRTRKFHFADGVVSCRNRSVDADLDDRSKLTRQVASELISLLDDCPGKKPAYPTFKSADGIAQGRSKWVVDGVSDNSKKGDKVTVIKKNGKLVDVTLTEKHTVGAKVYWSVRQHHQRRHRSRKPEKNFSSLYVHMIDYYLEPESDESENGVF